MGAGGKGLSPINKEKAMSLTKIYDTLVAEFFEAGKYYGGAMELPERVSLSAYDDTVVFQAVKDLGEPVRPVEEVLGAPKSMAAIRSLAERIAEIHSQEPINVPEETSETIVICAPKEEVQHVFPIRKKHHFDFFKTDRHQKMHAA